MLKHNLMQYSFIAILIICTVSLHNHQNHQANSYDSSLYTQSLNKRFQAYQSKLDQLRKEVETLNEKLSKAKDGNTSQTQTLKQGIAKQRNLLLDIQNIIQLPFEQRACDGNSLSESQKQQMKNKISSVKNSLNILRQATASQDCGNCSLKNELQLQINQQELYLKNLQQALNNQCKRVTKNLEKQNVTGLVDLSKTYYKDNLKATNWKYDTINKEQYRIIVFNQAAKYNLTSCPLNKPYVNKTQNYCFDCPEGLNFSLGQRKCIQCPNNFSYSTQFKQCINSKAIGKNCSSNQILNLTTANCDQIPGNHTSICPLDQPLWNATAKRCQPCPKDRPVFNQTTLQCQSCNDFSQSKACNQTKPQQQPNSINSSSICHPQLPYWNSTLLHCQECPSNIPFYNNKTHQCQACQSPLAYSPKLKQCINQQCPQGLIFIQQQVKCINITCPKQKPLFNYTTLQCQQCPPNQPVYQKLTTSCMKCPQNQPYYNFNSSQCEQCPSTAPKYDIIAGKCTRCFNDKPLFNNTTKQCQPCQSGTYYNFQVQECVNISNQTSVCPKDKPIYNIEKKICTFCPDYQIYDSQTGVCHIKCQEGKVFDTVDKQCIIICANGQSYDPQTDSCVENTQKSHKMLQTTSINKIHKILNANKRKKFQK